MGLLAISATASAQNTAKQMIALAGSGVNHISIIEKASARAVWRYDLPKGSECNSVVVDTDGNVYFSYKQGVCKVTQTGMVLWDLAVGDGSEAQTLRLQADGTVFVAVCGSPVRLLVLEAERGEILRETHYDIGIEQAHSQFRQAYMTAAGDVYIPVISQSKVIRVSKDGQKTGEWSVPPTPFSVSRISDNKLLVSTIGALIELDTQTGTLDRTVAKGAVGAADTLRFATQAERLANGSTMLSNWQGYAKNTDNQLLELDANGGVVYTFRDTTIMKNISGFYLFER